METNVKVLLGLSGGVDSAVAAYLLKEQGHDVTCLFMRNWDSALNNDVKGNPTINNEICPQQQDYLDAKSVADSLDLPILRVDFIKEYWDYVFESFLSEYKLGRTPNPDILCNKYIKFSCFYDYAMEHGFEMIAMGHYARVYHAPEHSTLLKALDGNKDQSYFLCQMPQNALNCTLFPLGDMTKGQVREIAERLDLAVAKKKDSTGVCFIGERNFKQFLNNYLPAKSGDMIDLESGNVIGQHTGVLYYTIGQRKGLGIGGAGGPWVVVGKDVQRNLLYLEPQSSQQWLMSHRCKVTDVNWLSTLPREGALDISVKFRYRQNDNPATLTFLSDTEVLLDYPQTVGAVTEGQSAVFYQGDVCLGGGIINDVFLRGDQTFHQVLAQKQL